MFFPGQALSTSPLSLSIDSHSFPLLCTEYTCFNVLYILQCKDTTMAHLIFACSNSFHLMFLLSTCFSIKPRFLDTTSCPPQNTLDQVHDGRGKMSRYLRLLLFSRWWGVSNDSDLMGGETESQSHILCVMTQRMEGDHLPLFTLSDSRL